MTFTHSLSRLLEAGLPLYEALMALEEKFTSSRMRTVILDLLDQIKQGRAFSEALSFHKESFDILICSIIANAEKSGSLSSALKEIADLLSKQNNLKRQILGSLLYPGILFIFSVLVIGVLLFFIIPSLFSLFEGRTLHPLTRIVLACSKALCENQMLIFSSFLSSVFLVFLLFFSIEKTFNRFMHCNNRIITIFLQHTCIGIEIRLIEPNNIRV